MIAVFQMCDDMNKNICPICGYNKLEEPPYDERGIGSCEICSCCGFEYGVSDDDKDYTFESYRKEWFEKGCLFSYEKEKPIDWSIEAAKMQLRNLDSNNLINY